MYIKKLIDMKKEERTLLHERMMTIAKEGSSDGAWSGINPYTAFVKLYRATLSDTTAAIALCTGLYCCAGLAVKLTKIFRR